LRCSRIPKKQFFWQNWGEIWAKVIKFGQNQSLVFLKNIRPTAINISKIKKQERNLARKGHGNK